MLQHPLLARNGAEGPEELSVISRDNGNCPGSPEEKHKQASPAGMRKPGACLCTFPSYSTSKLARTGGAETGKERQGHQIYLKKKVGKEREKERKRGKKKYGMK